MTTGALRGVRQKDPGRVPGERCQGLPRPQGASCRRGTPASRPRLECSPGASPVAAAPAQVF